MPSRRQNRLHPVRLSWHLPSDIGNDTAPDTQVRKRARRDEGGDAATKDLWVDEFFPNCSDDLCVAPKKVSEVKDWLGVATRSGSRETRKLLVLTGSSGVGKSTMVRVLAKEMGLGIYSWDGSGVPWHHSNDSAESYFSVKQSSPLDSFEKFLRRSSSGIAPLSLSFESTTAKKKKYIVLLEEIPNLHGEDAHKRFRRIISDHLDRSLEATVLIFSDVVEGRHRPEDLERLIDPSYLYASTSHLCQINGVTKTKMKRVLQVIANAKSRHLDPSFVEELHLKSGGDIRHAIMSFQTQSSRNTYASKSRQLLEGQNSRDFKFSSFHALGKLLYAKRTTDASGRCKLLFDPDGTLERTDFGIQGSLRFLEYHCTDFFQSENIEALSNAFDLYSDSSLLLDCRTRPGRALLEAAAASIAGRTMLHANPHPSTSKFRSFTTPQIFDVLRKRRQNDIQSAHLCRRLTQSHLSPSSGIVGAGVFVCEILPAARAICPEVVNQDIDRLSSIARDTARVSIEEVPTKGTGNSVEDQVDVLLEDDIVDDDSNFGEEVL